MRMANYCRQKQFRISNWNDIHTVVRDSISVISLAHKEEEKIIWRNFNDKTAAKNFRLLFPLLWGCLLGFLQMLEKTLDFHLREEQQHV